MFHESRMLGEVVVFAMLEDEDAILVKQAAIQYQVWYLWQFFQCVRRVGKDEVKLLFASLQEAKYVSSYQDVLVFSQFLEALAYEVGVVTICLHAHYLLATTGN